MARKKMILAAASVVTVANATTPPLELVFVERCGRKESLLADMPVRIVDEQGKVVFEGQSKGPYFHARLPKGRYTVSTRWDAWSSSRPRVAELRGRHKYDQSLISPRLGLGEHAGRRAPPHIHPARSLR